MSKKTAPVKVEKKTVKEKLEEAKIPYTQEKKRKMTKGDKWAIAILIILTLIVAVPMFTGYGEKPPAMIVEEIEKTKAQPPKSKYTAKWSDVVDYNKMESGIYWFDADNQPHRDGSEDSPFDPEKPTVILVHGWLSDAILHNYNPNFLYMEDLGDEPVEKNVVAAWIKDGYNVGVFNWVQFADECDSVKDAEAKIWTTDYKKGEKDEIGMRWRKADNTYETKDVPDVDAATLFYRAYIKAMEGYKGDHIRIVGHSLGNQMAIRLCDLVDKNIKEGNVAPELMPDRVALLEPYYSGDKKLYLNNRKTSEVCDKMAKNLIDNDKVVFEMVKSSELTKGYVGDENKTLENMCCFYVMDTSYFPLTKQGAKHTVVKAFYFGAKDPDFREKCKDPLTCSYLDNWYIASRMDSGNGFKWVQDGGNKTISPKDDTYIVKKQGLYVPVEDYSIRYNNKPIKDGGTAAAIVGQYGKIDCKVEPSNASAKIVCATKESGDKGCIQLTDNNGSFKAVKPGTVKLKFRIQNLNEETGEGEEMIEKTVNVVVR